MLNQHSCTSLPSPYQCLHAETHYCSPHATAGRYTSPIALGYATQVLSANPADLAGPLIMARVKPGDPHQLWFQDFWNQFGCSRRQGAAGVLGETCHIKSQAFVLVNKATRQLVWASEEGQPLTLAPYSMASNAELTRRCTLFDLASTVLQHTPQLHGCVSHMAHLRLKLCCSTLAAH